MCAQKQVVLLVTIPVRQCSVEWAASTERVMSYNVVHIVMRQTHMYKLQKNLTKGSHRLTGNSSM